MKHTAKLRTILLLISVCLFITVLGVALREKKSSIVVSREEHSAPATDAQMELNDVAYSTLGTDNARLWDLNARTARVFDDGKKLMLEGLAITFYQRGGGTYYLSADRGELDMDTRNIHISGSVKATLPDNATIETHSAFYDNTQRTILSHDPLTITRGPLVMQGTGMSADLEAETVSILHNVKVTGTR